MIRMRRNENGADGRVREIASAALAVVAVVATSLVMLLGDHAVGGDVDHSVPVVDRREAVLPELPESDAAVPKLDAGGATGR